MASLIKPTFSSIPLRIIFSEHVWKRKIDIFLKEMLSTISMDDPFRVKDTPQAISQFEALHHTGSWTALSLDVKDMYPSVNVEATYNIIRDKVEQQGLTEFESKAMMSLSQFLELLKLYLQTMVIKHQDTYFQQELPRMPQSYS